MVIKYFANYYNLDLVYKFYISDNDTLTMYYETKVEHSNPKMNESIYIDWKQDITLFVAVKEYLLSKYAGYSKE